MIQVKVFIFIIVLLIFSIESKAQISVDSLRKANKEIKIALKELIGNWQYIDSEQAKINFVAGDFNVHIEGIKHGIGNYRFERDKDSVFVNGTAANWPPYDCTLKLIDKNTLEIKFYQYFSKETFNIIYKKK
jgi:hypothetical protein